MVKGQPIEELEKQMLADVQATVDKVQQEADKLTKIDLNFPTRLPLVIDNNGKITIHGERNPHLSFVNATHNK